MNTQKLINTMEKDIAKSMSAISFKLLGSVIKKTPVDTAHAKNNWSLSEGKIDRSISKKRDPSINANVLKNITGKKDIYLTNSVNYILELENGGSKQAPRGMVATTINELKNL